jgi:hypothetical protein
VLCAMAPWTNTCAAAVAQWGWGKHEADLPSNIRNAPEGLLVSAYINFYVVHDLTPESSFGSPSFC